MAANIPITAFIINPTLCIFDALVSLSLDSRMRSMYPSIHDCNYDPPDSILSVRFQFGLPYVFRKERL